MLQMEQWKNARLNSKHRKYIESPTTSEFNLPERLRYFDQFANAYSEDFFAVYIFLNLFLLLLILS